MYSSFMASYCVLRLFMVQLFYGGFRLHRRSFGSRTLIIGSVAGCAAETPAARKTGQVSLNGATRSFGNMARTEPSGVKVTGCRMRCLRSRVVIATAERHIPLVCQQCIPLRPMPLRWNNRTTAR